MSQAKTEAGTLEAGRSVCYNPNISGFCPAPQRRTGRSRHEWSIALLTQYLQDPPFLVALLIAMLVGLTVHEASHAWVASRLGDDTAKRAGRLTLNPLRHLDPIGTLMIFFIGFGWAKPVPVSPWQLRHGPRAGMAMVAAAGPLSNLLLAVAAASLWRLGILRGMPEWAGRLVQVMVWLNVGLLLFNLIPLAPLDGSSVLNGVVGDSIAAALAPLQKFGPMILFGLIAVSYISPQLNIFGRILIPLRQDLTQLLLGGG
jgi:Zn-dependent protease